jgi:hypothetical protein
LFGTERHQRTIKPEKADANANLCPELRISAFSPQT